MRHDMDPVDTAISQQRRRNLSDPVFAVVECDQFHFATGIRSGRISQICRELLKIADGRVNEHKFQRLIYCTWLVLNGVVSICRIQSIRRVTAQWIAGRGIIGCACFVERTDFIGLR